MRSLTTGRPAAAGNAATVSGEARRLVGKLRAAGGEASLAELGAVRHAHTLAGILRELRALDVLEVRDEMGQPIAIDAVALLLKTQGRQRAGGMRARLLPRADRLALRVASGRAA